MSRGGLIILGRKTNGYKVEENTSTKVKVNLRIILKIEEENSFNHGARVKLVYINFGSPSSYSCLDKKGGNMWLPQVR